VSGIPKNISFETWEKDILPEKIDKEEKSE
jgi:hypothetical protein